MAGEDGRQMFNIVREHASEIGSSVSVPRAETVATKMYGLSALTYDEKDLIHSGKALVDCVLRNEKLPSADLLKFMKAFVLGLREAELFSWADRIDYRGHQGVTNIKENTITTQYGANKKPESKNADTTNEPKVPTRIRNPYTRGKGRAIIIYISKFNSTSASGSVSEETRVEYDAPGNAIDGKSLAEFFRSECGFYVEIIYNEGATRENITEQLKAVASDPNEEYNMFVCAVLSHGGINGKNKCFVKDYHLNDLLVEDITAPFKKAKSLAAKPKVFIFNACRGDNFEGYHTLSVGAPFQPEAIEREHIPCEAHFLHFYSSVEGFYSFTNSVGSLFVTTILNTLREENGLDIVAAFTDVIDQIAAKGPVPVTRTDATGKEVTTYEVPPTPCILSTLTKALYFR